MTIIVLFVTFVLCIMIGVPIAISMGMASVLALIVSESALGMSFVSQIIVNGTYSFTLLAIPFFLLSGELMGKGGISRRLIDCFKSLVGNKCGGLASVTVLACMFFAAISGSGPATVVAIGGLMAPVMIEDGYERGFVAGITGTAGAIGIIIPPSIPFVVYAVAANESVGSLFLSGIIPGIMIAAALCLYSYLYAKKRGDLIKKSGEIYTWRERGKIFWNAKWSLLVPVIILGGIYGGLFTPTEAAAVTVIYGFLIGAFVYKELKLPDIVDALKNTVTTTGTIMILVGASAVFSKLMTIEGIPQLVSNFLTSTFSTKVTFLIFVNVLFLIAGCIMDSTSATIILTPLLLPAAKMLGIDPIHFGTMMIVNLGIGFVTPPVGVNLFLGMQISGSKLGDAVRHVLPMIFTEIILLLLITYIPAISMFLPNLFR